MNAYINKCQTEYNKISFTMNLSITYFKWTTYRYSPDQCLLKLQEIAKHKNLGSLWSGMKKNMVLGAHQEDLSSVDEETKHLAEFEYRNLETLGYPLKYDSHQQVVRLQPWHERLCKQQLEHASRSQYKAHQMRLSQMPYGFVIDMVAERYQNIKK